MSGLLALHLTFGTYGTRLHGDERGTVTRVRNRPGDPFVPADAVAQQLAAEDLVYPPVRLTYPQRCAAEFAIPAVCARGGWQLHVCAAQIDHLHVLLSTLADPKQVRRWLKYWLGQSLTEQFPTALPRADMEGRLSSINQANAAPTWWAEGGSIKRIFNDRYFRRAYDYVLKQRATRA